MDTVDILRRVRRVEIKTARLANDILSGAYHSVFKGRGMDFEELREYVPGDDVRTIDRNVTARVGRPFVKIFREERELTVILAVDISASFDFGSSERTKRVLATEIAATLAFAAGRNNDKVGLLLFTEDTELFVPPRKGRRHTLRMIRDMLYHAPRRKGTDITAALTHLNRMLDRRAVIFLATDFLHTLDGDAKAEAVMKSLRVTAARHDLVCLHLHDAKENLLPAAGILTIEDAETGELLELDTRAESTRAAYAASGESRNRLMKDKLAGVGVDLVSLEAGEDYAAALRSFLQNRRRRRA